MNARVLILSATVVLLLIVVVWRSFSGDDQTGSDPLSDRDIRSLPAAERQSLEDLKNTDPLKNPEGYVQKLDTLSLKSVRRTMGSIRTRPKVERQQVLANVLAKSQKPHVREVAIVMVRQSGDADAKQMAKVLNEDTSTGVRIQAAAEIAKQSAWDGIPALINGMRDGDPKIREVCRDAFEKMFGVPTNFDPNASPAAREKIVRQIEMAYPKYKAYHDGYLHMKKMEKENAKKKK